jgi:S1-C subfamily serine protease
VTQSIRFAVKIAAVMLMSVGVASAQRPPPAMPDLDISTAFAIGSDGTFLTTAHGVDGCSSVDLLSRDMPPVEATVTARDKRVDLALVHATLAHPLPVLPLRRDNDLAIGEPIFLLGYPLLQPLRVTNSSFFTTVVSGVEGLGGDPGVFRLPIVVLPGMSGSAALDASGRIVGVVRTHLVQTAPNNGPTLGGESFVTTGRAISDFLSTHNGSAKADDEARALSPTEVAAKAAASSVAIACHK